MLWIRVRTEQIRPALDSLRRTFSQQQQHADAQQEQYLEKINWKVVACIISFSIFIILLVATLIGIPAILIKIKRESTCIPSSSDNAPFNDSLIPEGIAKFENISLYDLCSFALKGTIRLCTANASWNPIGITVAGQSNGLPSTSLAGLQYPYDIYVYGNGTILVADYGNNRITKWDPNSNVGVLIAGTGSYGSWSTLLAKPVALAVRNNQLYVSDSENYRIQMFPLNTGLSSPDATTLIGRYGQGYDINQINYVCNIIAPVSAPSLLLMADTNNHRILLWNADRNNAIVLDGMSGSFGSDPTRLYFPIGITLDERRELLYIADRSNNRIQKYNIHDRGPSVTVAGWGQLNTPSAILLDPSGANMFISDTLNHRILLWLNGALQGRIIAGNGTPGNSTFQLNSPAQIRFDANYNLYVVDNQNSRIQRFDLISNGC